MLSDGGTFHCIAHLCMSVAELKAPDQIQTVVL